MKDHEVLPVTLENPETMDILDHLVCLVPRVTSAQEVLLVQQDRQEREEIKGREDCAKESYMRSVPNACPHLLGCRAPLVPRDRRVLRGNLVPPVSQEKWEKGDREGRLVCQDLQDLQEGTDQLDPKERWATEEGLGTWDREEYRAHKDPWGRRVSQATKDQQGHPGSLGRLATEEARASRESSALKGNLVFQDTPVGPGLKVLLDTLEHKVHVVAQE